MDFGLHVGSIYSRSVSRPPSSVASKSNWLPGLDGLRAFSVAWVICFHLEKRDPLIFGEGIFRTMAFFGGQGVTVFFVISGFLITSLLLKEEQRTGGISLLGFYRRRAFRILPAAFVYIAIALAFTWTNKLQWNPLEWLGSAFFFRNLIANDTTSQLTSHYWSLSVEEQFYLIWPLMVMLASPRRRLWVTASLCLFAPVWRYLVMKLGAGVYANPARIDLNYDSLLIGAVLALLQQRTRFRTVLDRHPVAAILLPSTIIAFFALVRWSFAFGAFAATASPTAQAALIAVVIKIVSEGRCQVAQQVFNFSPVKWLGRLSYSLYLWQTLFCEFPGPGVLWKVPWCLTATLTAATFSYYLVERPFLRVRDRLGSAKSF